MPGAAETTRKIPAEQVRKIAEGRIYTGRQALDLGLIDELGGLEEAIEAARSMANIPPSAELKIVHYPRPGSLGELIESFGMVGVDTALDSFTKGITAAQPVSFHQQLAIFAQTMQPLCWMAVPNFSGPDALGSWGLAPLPQPLPGPAIHPLEQLIGG